LSLKQLLRQAGRKPDDGGAAGCRDCAPEITVTSLFRVAKQGRDPDYAADPVHRLRHPAD
jgi:hypothetical protein